MNLNATPEWLAVIASYEPMIATIAYKSTKDESLRDDCAQEARIALLEVGNELERIKSYDPSRPQDIPPAMDAYLRNTIRNSILTYLQDYKTGSWLHGREGQPSRFLPADYLEENGFDIDTDHQVLRLGKYTDRDAE